MLPAHIFCSNCGVKNQKNAAFCFNCGSQLARPDATANTFQTPANAAGSGQQAPTPPAQVSAPPKPVTEPPQAQGANPTLTSPGDSTTSEINSATGFLSTNTILKQRYRILHSVGRGGMGAVYMGEDTQMGHRLVAIKEMSQGSLYPQEIQMGIDNFKHEAHLLAGLQHPNLPSIHDHFEQNQRWYLVMSFIQGETLHDYMKYIPDGKLPLEEVLKIGTELCSVLHYLHTYQPPIIFRDLKPSNIMRDKNGHIYLIDFGIARHFKPGQEKDTASYASAGYAAPEQYGRAQTTPRSDIYSLGATLYHLISGYAPSQSPFHLPPLQALVPTLPPRLTSLITHMLDLEENRRPLDMMAVQQEMEAITSSPATPNSEAIPAEQPSSGATPQTTGHPATPMRLILPAKVRIGVLTGLGSVLALIGLGFLIRGTGIAWHQYLDYHYSDYYYLDYPGAGLPLIIGSSVLLFGFFTLYIPWAKNLSTVAVAPITGKRKTLARVGVFLGYILLVWGAWGWIHAAPDIYNGTGGFSYDAQGYFKNPYMGITLGFAFIALTGVFIILATTTKPFGHTHTKNKMEMTQRIIATLATFILVVGTTFLQSTTIAVFILCFLIGGAVLIATQMRRYPTQDNTTSTK
jgi:hypothetical protein